MTARPKPRVSRFKDLEPRFWSKVVKGDGCWRWIGGIAERGYGQIYRHGVRVRAHRISWELHFGPIPDGMEVLHKCDEPNCVRPDHLFIGTKSDNLRDAYRKGRRRGPLPSELRRGVGGRLMGCDTYERGQK